MSLKISVITVCYQAKDGLLATMASVFGQDYPDLDYIVIDGGSTDGTLEVLQQHADRLAFWSSEPDKGIYDAMNKGIRQAQGDWLLFLNAGDTFVHPQVVSQLLPYLQTGTPAVVYGNIIKLYRNHKEKGCQLAQAHVDLVDFFYGTIDHQAAFIRRELFDKYGLYDLTYPLAADWFFFMTVIGLHHEPCLYVDVDIAYFRMDGMSTSHPEQYEQERQAALQQVCGPYYPYLKELSEYRLSSFLTRLLHIRQKLRTAGVLKTIRSVWRLKL